LAEALQLLANDLAQLQKQEPDGCCADLMQMALPHILAASLLLAGTTPEFQAAMGEAS
jgi:hypothetical protein